MNLQVLIEKMIFCKRFKARREAYFDISGSFNFDLVDIQCKLKVIQVRMINTKRVNYKLVNRQ